MRSTSNFYHRDVFKNITYHEFISLVWVHVNQTSEAGLLQSRLISNHEAQNNMESLLAKRLIYQTERGVAVAHPAQDFLRGCLEGVNLSLNSITLARKGFFVPWYKASRNPLFFDLNRYVLHPLLSIRTGLNTRQSSNDLYKRFINDPPIWQDLFEVIDHAGVSHPFFNELGTTLKRYLIDMAANDMKVPHFREDEAFLRTLWGNL
jgi:hypothetical protein